jgi:hypothetical protein
LSCKVQVRINTTRPLLEFSFSFFEAKTGDALHLLGSSGGIAQGAGLSVSVGVGGRVVGLAAPGGVGKRTTSVPPTQHDAVLAVIDAKFGTTQSDDDDAGMHRGAPSVRYCLKSPLFTDAQSGRSVPLKGMPYHPPCFSHVFFRRQRV